MFHGIARMAWMALLIGGDALARPAPPPQPPLPKVQELVLPNTLRTAPHYHQRLFASNEVAFGAPAERMPRAAVIDAALRDLKRADQPWLQLPAAGMAENRYRGWLALLRDVRNEPSGLQVTTLNRFINAQPYRADASQADAWRAPWEFLTSQGDSEEYALTKYVSLRHLGMAAERLRIVLVRDTARNEYHAVLALYLDDDVLILDNRADAVVSHRDVQGWQPVYSLNEREIWFHWRDGEPAPTVFVPQVLQLAAR
jgi:predicted transglutaminase-like cysteine proteinase